MAILDFIEFKNGKITIEKFTEYHGDKKIINEKLDITPKENTSKKKFLIELWQAKLIWEAYKGIVDFAERIQ